jgi:AcrR family transcriptional regulator
MDDQPQDSPPRSRKETILEVATSLFAERGYEGASMNDVAERAGMRKASLFYHFASKEALYEAVLDRLLAKIAGALAEVYAREGPFAERLDAAADVTTAVLGSNPFAARLLLREAMDWGPAIRGKLLDPVLAVLDATVAFIRAGQEAGAFVEGDAKHLVLTTLGFQLIPFTVGHLVERFAGTQPFDEVFVTARRQAVRMQTRAMLLRGTS